LAADMVTKAPLVAPTTWWYEGYAEIGGRFDISDPGQRTLGRFYKYEDLRPGVFGDYYFGAHRTGADPWDLAFWGTNAGWDDQAFGLEMSKPGTYYLGVTYDQTPHVYSKDAKTTFSRIGSTFLVTAPYPYPPSALSVAAVNANSTVFDLGFRRDTASAGGRWTPDDNWDVRADYSYQYRSGTQPGSFLTFTNTVAGGAPTRAAIQLPKPVDETTQSANVKTEYAGSTPWSKPFNVALGYNMSLYHNNADSLTFQNPWAAANNVTFPLMNRYSLPPSNQAHSLNLTSGVGLPWNSRYMGTFQYTWMIQDETFMPSTINPAVALMPPPMSSLNGSHTMLANNVINTKITSDLSSTLKYRYYEYISDQAPVFYGIFENVDTNNAPATVITRPVNFTKQNASAQLDWRPWKWLNTGAVYDFERQAKDMQGTDVVTNAKSGTGYFNVVTNEHSIKGFADANLWSWSTLRTSLRYADRRLGNDYVNPLSANPPSTLGQTNNPAFRFVDFQNRDSTEAKALWVIDVSSAVTITPTAGYRFDHYASDGVSTFGIRRYEAWNAGGDLSWIINPMATVYLSYIHEDGMRDVYNGNANVSGGVAANLDLLTRDHNDTFIVGTKVTAIPETLFLTLNYTYTHSTSQWTSNCGPTGNCLAFGAVPWPTYPDTHNTNHRIDAQAKYMLDRSWLRNAGLLPTAQPYIKLRGIYERNSNDSWQNVQQQLGFSVDTTANTTLQRAVFLGMSNPNYDVFVGMASFGVKW
jgi:MtrB/PioB family decaheme-associated outer membrane protein